MARTSTEQIQELTSQVARTSIIVQQQRDDTQRTAERLTEDLRRAADTLNETSTRVAVLESRCDHLQKEIDKAKHREWMLALALLASLFAQTATLMVVAFRCP